jgi:hypothetical protein
MSEYSNNFIDDDESDNDFIEPELLKTRPSIYWKFFVDKFLATLNEKEQSNFQLASSKFAVKEPHLFIKDVPWFKEWYKENNKKYIKN